MGVLKPISDGLFIEDSFGPLASEQTFKMLVEIAESIQRRSDRQSPKTVFILNSPFPYPLCCDAVQMRNIFLSITDNLTLFNWVYQFSHEYCHHIIDGALSDKIEGLSWFEETICELSSIFHILNPPKCLTRQDCQELNFLARNVLLESHQDLKSQIQANGGVRQWLTLLSEPQHHRHHYNAIACRMLPFFQSNPKLWRILGHIGDARQWDSLEELFAHLEKESTEEYRQSLVDLRKSLLP